MSSSNVDDRFSTLPEEIISHILSLTPTKFVVRTSILSKRWRNIWRWINVTKLDFDDILPVMHGGTDGFSEFVDSVLELCEKSQLFRLHFPRIYDPKSSVSNWIDKVVELNVQELDLRVHHCQLPRSMFVCESLTKLTLDHSSNDRNVWEFLCPINLPCLKTLDICVFANPFENAFKLISGCPILECLSLKISSLRSAKTCIFNIPTLKRLELTFYRCSFVCNKVALNVPNLIYLFLGGTLCSSFVMEDVSSLIEASVSFNNITSDRLWFELLKGINGVQSFSAKNETYRLMIPLTSPLPIFFNMKHLKLKGVCQYGLVSQFLESCPELKHLCIDKVVEEVFKKRGRSSSIEPQLVPDCMRTNLTTIEFSNCYGQKSEMQFLEYMLRKADVLKTMTITWDNLCKEEEKRLCAQLLKVPRASRKCEIHFLGKYSFPDLLVDK